MFTGNLPYDGGAYCGGGRDLQIILTCGSEAHDLLLLRKDCKIFHNNKYIKDEANITTGPCKLYSLSL